MRLRHEVDDAHLRPAELVENETVILKRLSCNGALQTPTQGRSFQLLHGGQFFARFINSQLRQPSLRQIARLLTTLFGLRRELPLKRGLFVAAEILA